MKTLDLLVRVYHGAIVFLIRMVLVKKVFLNDSIPSARVVSTDYCYLEILTPLLFEVLFLDFLKHRLMLHVGNVCGAL